MDYTDSEFIAAAESCSIASFHHRDHIRLALLYVTCYGAEAGTARMVETIRRLADHAGHPEKYHHTMTLAWMRLAAMMLDKSALSGYYSDAALLSEEARTGWREPDLAPLP